jgi:hypothetical protein
MYRETARTETVTTATGHEVTLELVRVAIDGVQLPLAGRWRRTDLCYEVTLSSVHDKQLLGRIEDREAAVAAFDACLAGIAPLAAPNDKWGRRAPPLHRRQCIDQLHDENQRKRGRE